MPNQKKEFVTVEDAREQVEILARRLALLHLAYAKTLMKELGEERGKKLILKAIRDYGIRIGEKLRRGSQDLPKYGVHERVEWVHIAGEKRVRVYGCVLADEWKKLGESSLGRLYCYVDLAKSMAADPTERIAHEKAIPDGDEFCELVFRRTTAKERKDFADEEADWGYLDIGSTTEEK